MQSKDGNWRIIDDFDLSSRFDRCSVTGLTKRAGDVGVFRPLIGHVDQEGYFDLSQYAVEKAAELLGWRPPEQVRALESKIVDLEKEVDRASKAAWDAATNALKLARPTRAKP